MRLNDLYIKLPNDVSSNSVLLSFTDLYFRDSFKRMRQFYSLCFFVNWYTLNILVYMYVVRNKLTRHTFGLWNEIVAFIWHTDVLVVSLKHLNLLKCARYMCTSYFMSLNIVIFFTHAYWCSDIRKQL